MSSAVRLVGLARLVLFVLATLVFAMGFARGNMAVLPLCSDVCSEAAPCDFLCAGDDFSTIDCGHYNGGQANGECSGF